MTWFSELAAPSTLGAIVGGILAAAFLWWALADWILATFELPSSDAIDRWRQRLGPGRDAGDEDEGAGARA
jgi:hypothetical protein